MNISQKCQYAVRSILELAKNQGQGPMAIAEIASRQAIPPRFLENILNELRQGGYVESRRGVQGGYLLTLSPRDITVGQIIRFVDGSLEPVKCISNQKGPSCPLRQQCALVNLWIRAKNALEEVYDGTTFEDLVLQERTLDRSSLTDYCI